MYDNQADKFMIAIKSVQEPKLSQFMHTHYHVYKPGLPGRRKNIRTMGGTKRALCPQSVTGHRSGVKHESDSVLPPGGLAYANEANDIVRLSVGEPSAGDRPGNHNHPFIRSQVSCVELRRQVDIIWRNDRTKECSVLVGDMRSDPTRVPLSRTPPPPRSPFTGHLSRSVFFSPPTTLCLKLFHWQ